MGKSQYVIQFGGLPIGEHQYDFEINDSFFEHIFESEIKKADITVNINFIKQNNLMQLFFDFFGTVEVICDRCLIEYNYPISGEEKLVVKYGNSDESNDEILVLKEGVEEIDFSHYLYEYIALALPNRKIPCEDDEFFDSECDEETLSKFNETKVDEEPRVEENNEWNKLKNIKFNNN